MLDANNQLQTVDGVGRRGASCPSRGSSRSARDGIVDGSFEGVVGDRGARGRDQVRRGAPATAAERSSGRRPVSSGRVLEPVPTTCSPSLVAGSTPAPATASTMCSARCPGGNSAPFSSVPIRNATSGPSAVRSRKPVTLVRPSASMLRRAGPVDGRRPGTRPQGRARDGTAERARSDRGRAVADMAGGTGRRATASARTAGHDGRPDAARSRRTPAPVPLLPGLTAGSPGRAPRAGRRDPARTSASSSRHSDAERIDAAGRRRGQGRQCRRDRSTRTTHSTISPPSRLDRGEHREQRAAGGQDVVDEQHPLAGRDREPAPELAAGAAVGAMRPPPRRSPGCPSWRPVSNARITPPVVGPATRSTVADAVVVPVGSPAQNPHSSLVAAGSWRTWNFSR